MSKELLIDLHGVTDITADMVRTKSGNGFIGDSLRISLTAADYKEPFIRMVLGACRSTGMQVTDLKINYWSTVPQSAPIDRDLWHRVFKEMF